MTAATSPATSDGFYQSILRQIGVGFCIIQIVLDDDGNAADYRFIEVNERFSQETGLHNVIGRTAREAVPGLEDFWVETYGRIALTGVGEHFGGGSVPMGGRYFDVHAFPIESPDRLHVAIVFTDITQQKHLEQQQEDFLTMASHDLRSPVTIIKGRAQLMRRRQLYDERAIEAIIDSAQRIDRLAEDLQGLINLEQGIELHRRPIDLVALVARVVEQHQIEDLPNPLHLEADEPSIVAQVDADRILQVMANLLGNAIKYSPDGGAITVGVRDDGAMVEIVVEDNGLGIPPESLEHLFVRFYRAANASVAKGLGLGLYITKMLVDAHGGEIAVTSEVGTGSRFVVRLPRG